MPKYRKAPKGWYSADVEWRVPGRKRPVAYSTVATEGMIVMLAQQGGTVQEVHDRILFDREAKMVLQVYIDRGYGDTIASQMFG